MVPCVDVVRSVRRKSSLRVRKIRPHPSSLAELLAVLTSKRNESPERRVVIDALVVRHAVDIVKNGRVKRGALGEGSKDGLDWMMIVETS